MEVQRGRLRRKGILVARWYSIYSIYSALLVTKCKYWHKKRGSHHAGCVWDLPHWIQGQYYLLSSMRMCGFCVESAYLVWSRQKGQVWFGNYKTDRCFVCAEKGFGIRTSSLFEICRWSHGLCWLVHAKKNGRLKSEENLKSEKDKSRDVKERSNHKCRGEVNRQIPLERVLVTKFVHETGNNLSKLNKTILKILTNLLNKKCTKREGELRVPQLPAACTVLAVWYSSFWRFERCYFT